MSAASLMSALAQGFTAQQVVQWLSNNHKQLSKKVKNAKINGYSDDQILTYLTKGQHASHGQRNEMLSGMSEHEKGSRIFNQGTDLSKASGAINLAGNLATGGLAAYGALKAAPAAINAVRGAFGGSTTAHPNIGPAPMSNAPVSPPPVNHPSPPSGAAAIANAQANISGQTPQQPQGIQTPAVPSLSPQQSIGIIDKMGIGQQIQTLKAAGNAPDAISTAVSVSLKPSQKKWLDEQIKEGKAKPLAEMIADYAGQTTAKQPIAKESVSNEKPQEVEKEPERLGKGNLVSTQEGITGDIESIRDKQALVKDHEGKLHKVQVDDLIESPLPAKDLAELHDDLISGIEKETGQQVSRNVNWAGYDSNNNSLAYLPHSGGLYIYNDISPEDAKRLTTVLQKRRSTGENYIGPWEEGTTSPIGSAMYDLIQKLKQERGKGKEYSHKFDTVYNALEPAIRAAKKKKKKKP